MAGKRDDAPGDRESPAAVAVREALDALAVSPIRDEIIRRALVQFGANEIPESAQLGEFVNGPLRDAVISLFDEHTADALVRTLASIVGRASSRGSGVVRRISRTTPPPAPTASTRRTLLYIGADTSALGALAHHLEGAANVEAVDDVLSLRPHLAGRSGTDVRVVIDTRPNRPRAGRIGAIARQLRPATRVIVWGASSEDGKLLATGHPELDWLAVSAEAAASEIAILVTMSGASGQRHRPVSAAPPRPILIVEQDSVTRRQLVEQIGLLGYPVLTAATGAEALAMCAQRKPRLVLVDQALPGMGGVEMARLLRHAAGKNAPPVVVLVSDLLDASDLGDLAAALPKALAPEKIETILRKLAPQDR